MSWKEWCVCCHKLTDWETEMDYYGNEVGRCTGWYPSVSCGNREGLDEYLERAIETVREWK